MITRKNESNILAKDISCECIYFIEKNLIQITGGIMINVDVNVKDVMYVNKIIFGIAPHV